MGGWVGGWVDGGIRYSPYIHLINNPPTLFLFFPDTLIMGAAPLAPLGHVESLHDLGGNQPLRRILLFLYQSNHLHTHPLNQTPS